MFLDCKKEYSVYRTLTSLSKQRVAMVLQPGNVWVIEKAIQNTEENDANIQTCLMRGWVEILHESIPNSRIDPDNFKIPDLSLAEKRNTYRLTDSGWNAIHRTHVMGLLGIIVALASALIGLLSLR